MTDYKLVPTELIDRFPEINPHNFHHDDACALNDWGVELVQAAVDAYDHIPAAWKMVAPAVQSKPLRYTNDGALAECPCCGSIDVGGAHDTVHCQSCGLTVTKPRPLQNAIDAWNMRTGRMHTSPAVQGEPVAKWMGIDWAATEAPGLVEALRQYRHNDGSGFVFGYDLEATKRVVAGLVEALEEARRAIGDHHAPNDCYATGPATGDSFRDLVQCPACSFIEMYDAARAAHHNQGGEV